MGACWNIAIENHWQATPHLVFITCCKPDLKRYVHENLSIVVANDLLSSLALYWQRHIVGIDSPYTTHSWANFAAVFQYVASQHAPEPGCVAAGCSVSGNGAGTLYAFP